MDFVLAAFLLAGIAVLCVFVWFLRAHPEKADENPMMTFGVLVGSVVLVVFPLVVWFFEKLG